MFGIACIRGRLCTGGRTRDVGVVTNNVVDIIARGKCVLFTNAPYKTSKSLNNKYINRMVIIEQMSFFTNRKYVLSQQSPSKI